MDTVINKLWEIEEAAGAITDEANVRKKAFAKEMEDKTASFDAGLEQQSCGRFPVQGRHQKRQFCLPSLWQMLSCAHSPHP